MAPRIWPENPVFKSDAEALVFNTLYESLGDRAIVFSNLRITDPQQGDIEIDFVVLIDGLGAVIIEVKGGNVTYNGQKWIQSDKTGSREIDPHGQALKGTYGFRNFLRNNWRYGNLKAEWLIAIPDSAMGTIHIPGVPRDRIIDRAELPTLISRMNAVLTSIQNHHAPRERDWLDKAFDAVRGHDIAETDRDAFLDNNYTFIKQMTHERKAILDLIQGNDRIYIHGPAGSGKTWLAFEQAQRWSQQGLKVGILVYNRGLATYMQRKCDEISGGPKPARISTFHQYIHEIGLTEGPMDGFIQDWSAYQGQISQAIGNLTSEEKFDAWIVDEAQDIKDEWWSLLTQCMRDPVDGKMAIFGDPEQSVYGSRGHPEGYFADITLNENLRNSQQIAKSVQRFSSTPVLARGPHGYEVEYIEVPTEADVLGAADDVVAHLADEELWNLGEIALLTTKHRHPIQVDKDGDKDAYWSELWEESDVFYGTVMGFKGLERSVVVLAVNGFHNGADIDDVMYVGMTRARDRLVVINHAEKENSLEEK
jgi:AAA domain/Nuclease-related domain/UvrD-like helicase C-terminal domain